MTLLARTRPGWFAALEQQAKSTDVTITVAVYHPEFSGRLRFERGRCDIVGRRDDVASQAALRGLGEGGYFQVSRPAVEPITVCVEPGTGRIERCSAAEHDALFEAFVQRRFFQVIDRYCRLCASCDARGECTTASRVQANMPQLITLTQPGGHETLTD